MINIEEIKKGDIFSESSHYTFEGYSGNDCIFKHHESNVIVKLNKSYVSNLLNTADSFTEEVIVGKEDKSDGTLGIRSIWENINSDIVFAVCYEKQAKKKTKKELETENKEQINKAINIIESSTKKGKSKVESTIEALKYIQSNPIKEFNDAEDRILRGYKVQFKSRDGRYDCKDMYINEIRPVNINTIKWLIIKGIKYTVK